MPPMQPMQPDIRPIKESGALYELNQPYSFQMGLEIIVIPKGFKYDGASYAKLLFQRDGIHRAACLVHDYLYEHEGKIGNITYTRKRADVKFRQMLLAAGVKSWHVWASYTAVRLFGTVYWDESKNGPD